MRQPRSMPWIDNGVKTLLDHLLPWGCLVCAGTADQDYGLCAGCERELPTVEPACPRCAAGTGVASTCGACLHDPPAFDQTLASFRYAVPLTGLIHALKYRRQVGVAWTLGRAMAHTLAARLTHRPDAIVPVPLHRRRLRERGFNQALELARPLARATGIPIRFAVRQRHTPAQTDLPSAQRRRNVRAAFRAPPRLRLDSIAIVDDVMTTGATANALAVALKSDGVRHVQVWVLARA